MAYKIYLDCHRIAKATRYDPCQHARDRVHNARRMAKTKSQGRNTVAWRNLRVRVLERDGYQFRRRGSSHYWPLTSIRDSAAAAGTPQSRIVRRCALGATGRSTRLGPIVNADVRNR
jgi:hypothetical protein